MSLLIPFIIGLAIMLLIMMKTKINPFFALLFGSLIIGLGCGLSYSDTLDSIVSGLSGTCKSLAFVIIFGTVLGEYIEKTNGTQRIAKTLLKVTGNENASIALTITGFIVSIPVFADVALIMLAPLVKAVAEKSNEWWVTSYNAQSESVQKDVSDSEMPSFFAAVFPILVPMILIIADTVCGLILPDGHPVADLVGFLGNKNIALAIGIVVAAALLHKKMPEGAIYKGLSSSLEMTGPIIFITAAGGALSKIIANAGVGDAIVELLSGSGLPVILIPFLVTGLSKFAQGSGSVAVVMGASMALPFCEAGLLNPVVAFLAICAGSQAGSHVNNSFFWVFANVFGYDTKTALKSLCVGQHVLAAAGLVFAFGVSLFLK